MRTLIMAALAALAILAAAPTARAQGGHTPPNTTEQRQAMARLAPLVGGWTGEARVSSPVQATGHHVEQVESALDGLLIIFRGTSYANPQHTGAPVFQALAVVSYNDASDTYEFRSYTRGYASSATASSSKTDRSAGASRRAGRCACATRSVSTPILGARSVKAPPMAARPGRKRST